MSAGPSDPASGPKVFITYRREETAPHAGRLYDAMVSRFGQGNVFMDVEMAPGVDFVDRITEAVAACHVLIVVMGPRWATVEDQHGRARLADPEDFVRLEVETALRRPEVTPIPVLVSGAQMPNGEDLPPELRAITRRNALELSDLRWRYDVERLISTLDELLAGTTAVDVAPTRGDLASRTDEPAEVAAPTKLAGPARTAGRGRGGEWFRGRGRLLAGIAALAVVAVGGVLALGGGGGGSGGGGTPSLEFVPYTGDAFTVEVPKGWRRTMTDEPVGQVLKTKFVNPDNEGTAEIDVEAEAPPANRLSAAQQARSQEPGYSLITVEKHPAADRGAQLFEYEHDEDFGPATVATYFFNAGDFGWRTRAAVAQKVDDSLRMAEEIATRMATTLEPR